LYGGTVLDMLKSNFVQYLENLNVNTFKELWYFFSQASGNGMDWLPGPYGEGRSTLIGAQPSARQRSCIHASCLTACLVDY
jgi:hypothetical protein